LLRQPGNVLSVRPWCFEIWFRATSEGLIERQEVLEQQRSRPAIQQQVVPAKEELVFVLSKSEKREAQQRRLAEKKILFAIANDECLKSPLTIVSCQ
jgi:hypothetical protein